MTCGTASHAAMHACSRVPCKLVSHLNGGCLGRQGLDALVCPAQLLGRHAPDGAQAALLLVQPSHHVRLADDVGDVA